MKFLPWCFLLACVIFYLLFGGLVFMVLEQHLVEEPELEQEEHHPHPDPKHVVCITMKHLRPHLHAILDKYIDDRDDQMVNQTKYIVMDILHHLENNSQKIDPSLGRTVSVNLEWDYYNSVVYAFTIITTIGYGHLTPATDASKILAVFYGLVGIPLHMILVRALGEYFRRKVVGGQKSQNRLMVFGNEQLRLILQVICYFIPGFMAFVIVPAGLFAAVEHWTFTESFYFTGISLLTVGLGDYVPGMMHANGNIWLWIYKIFVFIWIEIGLGYIMMILGFVTRALLHKNVRRLIKRKLNNFLRFETPGNETLLEDVKFLQMMMGRPQPMELPSEKHVENLESQTIKIDYDKITATTTIKEEQFLVPNDVLAAVVNVLRHGVVQQVLESVNNERRRQEPLNLFAPHSTYHSTSERIRRRKPSGRPETDLNAREVKRSASTPDKMASPPHSLSRDKTFDDVTNNFSAAFGRFSSNVRPMHGHSVSISESSPTRTRRRKRKLGIPSVILENQVTSSDHRKSPWDRKMSAPEAQTKPYVRQRHMSLNVATTIDDFSRMLDTLQNKLEQPVEIPPPPPPPPPPFPPESTSTPTSPTRRTFRPSRLTESLYFVLFT